MYELDSIINNEEKILKEFAEGKNLYFSFMHDLEDIVPTMLSAEGIDVSSIDFRIKDDRSLREKIQFKGKYQSITDITDIIGVRIITLFEKDIEKTVSVLQKEFTITEVTDKRKKNHTDRIDFGYNSLHLIMELSPERCNLVEYKRYAGLKFEVQLRTALQHAWASVEHGLGYKSKYEIPTSIRRRLARISATLEVMDEEFEYIKSFVGEYNSSINKTDRILRTEINKNSLIQYVNNSEAIRDLYAHLSEKYGIAISVDEELISRAKIVQRYTFLGVEYINDLERVITEQSGMITAMIEKWIDAVRPESLNIFSILIFFMMYLAAEESKDVASEMLNL